MLGARLTHMPALHWDQLRGAAPSSQTHGTAGGTGISGCQNHPLPWR